MHKVVVSDQAYFLCHKVYSWTRPRALLSGEDNSQVISSSSKWLDI
jgi:hypothetical protein